MKQPTRKYRIPIARPSLPELESFQSVAADIFERRQLSNFSKYSRLLEERAVAALGHARPLSVSSCDIGMVLAWRALGCRQGEVITPSFTFCSTVNALRWNGLEPVFCDIDPASFCIDARQVRRLIGPRTVGIAAVHVFGRSAPIDELEQIAGEHGLPLVFDAAQGVGARHHGRALGGFGDASCFSLSGTKLVSSGEGGLVAFRSDTAAERFRRLRSYGFLDDYHCRDIGLNGKISELNAALGWLSLDLLESVVARRRVLAAEYRTLLVECPDLQFQEPADGDSHAYKDFAILFRQPQQRARVEQALDQRGIQTKRYFFPVHRMAAHARFCRSRLPVTEDIYQRLLCIPIFHELTAEQQQEIARTIIEAVRPAGVCHGVA